MRKLLPATVRRRNNATALLFVGLAACLLATPACSLLGGNREPVVLIVIDTLRADHLGVYGYQRPTSPAIDKWAEEAAVFDRAFSTSPWTLPAFGSIYTGQLPTRHAAGVRVRKVAQLPARDEIPQLIRHADTLFFELDSSLKTLAEILRDKGYTTGAVINNAFLKPRFGIDRGFETYDYTPKPRVKIRTADATVDRALRWLDENPEGPFFLVLHIFDPHMPYAAPAPFAGKFSNQYADTYGLPIEDFTALRQEAKRPTEKGRIAEALNTALYDEEIAFSDHELGRFLDGLKARGIWGRALVMLTSDHGEELHDHGRFEHGHTVYNELLRVPLMVWGPDVRPGRYSEPVSLVDMMPTILETVGVRAPQAPVGVSLRPLLTTGTAPQERLLYAERTLYKGEKKAVIRWPWKAIIDLEKDRQLLFDLEADPAEKVNLAPQRTAVLYELLGRLQETMLAADQQAQHNEVLLDAETLKNLRALGYLR
ncbi:MAG: sulfatase [Acidobacteriota bacterium]